MNRLIDNRPCLANWRSLWSTLLAIALLCVSGCSNQSETPVAEVSTGYEKTYDRGPVTVTIRLDKQQATIADQLNLVLQIDSDENFNARMPQFGEKLEQFTITDFTTAEPQLIENNRTRQTRTYVLEPFLSGDYEIPTMNFEFSRADSDEVPKQIETESIKVRVNSLLANDIAKLEINEIAPPVDLPRNASSKKWLWFIPAIFALLAICYWFWKKRKPSSEPVKIIRPAHEIALEELEALAEENLPEQNKIKLYYQRISDILRRYIENRFDLQAPEQTTEEFLAELGGNHIFAPGQKSLLKEFLKHCDLVKFAEHQPTSDDIQKTSDSCKNFILQTRVFDASEKTAD